MQVGQLGPEFVMLTDRVDHPPCEGEMFLSIDGSEQRWTVRLDNGISANAVRTPIKAVG
jgi:hypothetical protein